MERSTPVRKPHTSTADLLTWSETPVPDASSTPASRSAVRSHQPSDGISKVVFGGQVTDEEVESLNKRKPCSGYKLKEITGSGIFTAHEENGESEAGAGDATPNGKTGSRMYQQTVAGISQISFVPEKHLTPKKPSTIPEVAKQRELSGTLESEDVMLKRQISDAKNRELSGHDIFAPPPEVKVRPLPARSAFKESKDFEEPRRNFHTSGSNGTSDGGIFGGEPEIRTAKKIPNQKFAELSGNDIFKGDAPPSSSDKQLSGAKLREISGNNIFADGKIESRDYFGGVRKPPGGGSSIALV
uniref:DUF4057 domain-containing protein n=1 Tax=Kalanchoe fedtschenkoi TaxID=63787 RepID=A0A7N1A3R6_KALFE